MGLIPLVATFSLFSFDFDFLHKFSHSHERRIFSAKNIVQMPDKKTQRLRNIHLVTDNYFWVLICIKICFA